MAASEYLSKAQHASKMDKRRKLARGGPGLAPYGSGQYGYGSMTGWWGEDTWSGDRDNDPDNDGDSDSGGDGGGDGGGGE